MEYWLYYLNNLADTIEIPPKLQNDEILTDAFRVAEFLALDKDAQWSYQQDLKRRLDYKAVLDYAKEEAELKGMEKGMERGIEKGMKQGIEQGIEKGIKQGQKQEKIQIAKNLLDVLDDDTLSQKTGLSVDEIAKLRD